MNGPSHQPEILIIKNINVIDCTGAPVKSGMTVTISGNKILAIEPAARARSAKAARVIDGSGKYLIPGLWDMHVHLSFSARPIFPALISHGVTAVRDMGGDIEKIDGWREQINSGDLAGPRIFRAGNFIDGPKQMTADRAALTLVTSNEEEARRNVIKLKERGADFIKIHNGVAKSVFFAIAAEAKRQGITFVTHLPRTVRAEEASDAGAKSLEHTENLLESVMYANPDKPLGAREAAIQFDDAKAMALFKRFVSNGTWYVPTLIQYKRLTEAREGTEKEVADARKQLFERLKQLVYLMKRTGVGVMAGSDFARDDIGPRPGSGLHDEICLLVEAGFTPLEALQAATREPAKFFNLSDSSGTVEKGQRADLVILEANPLDDINNIRKIVAVIINGNAVSNSSK